MESATLFDHIEKRPPGGQAGDSGLFHQLSANFATLVCSGGHIDVPFTSDHVSSLSVGQCSGAFEQTSFEFSSSIFSWRGSTGLRAHEGKQVITIAL